MSFPDDYAIETKGLSRLFGDFVAVDGITLKIPVVGLFEIK
jgi:hypothetical protein